jgi:hypothetical protein
VTIAIRGSTPLVVASGTGAATISGTLTSTRQPQAGDELIIIHGNDFYTAATMPTPTVGGSTTGVNAIVTADGGSNFAHAKAYRYTVPSTGDLAISVTETGTADEEKCLIAYVLSGADTSTVIDVSAASFNSTGSGDNSPVAPSVAPSSSTGYLICHTNSGGGANVASYTPPSGMTEVYDQSAGGFMGCSGAVLQLAASGATGTKTFTGASVATWATLSIVVLTGSASSTYVRVPSPRPRQAVAQRFLGW